VLATCRHLTGTHVKNNITSNGNGNGNGNDNDNCRCTSTQRELLLHNEERASKWHIPL
jgi:hypothetical protein